ncbi:chorismate-binding protein [Angustibacter aerolatus]
MPGPDDELAWFGGHLATGLLEVRRGPDAFAGLDEGGWWGVVVDYEGAVTAARFADVRPAPLPPPSAAWPDLAGAWESSLDHDAYVAAVQEVRTRIGRGEVYQVNACRVLTHPLPGDADVVALAARLQARHPAPHQGLVRLPGVEVVCASPELFLRRDGDVVLTGPIKGTATSVEALLPKDVDENVMIVDLARHDLHAVCDPGSVEVVDLLRPEHHPGLVHLVSRVRGRLRAGTSWRGLLEATLPPASVTGAPKSTALQAIADLEPVPRGPYCGAVGWVDADRGTAELAVGIRSFWTSGAGAGRRLHFGTGAGITWGSDPEGEWDETELKARRLVSLASATLPP